MSRELTSPVRKSQDALTKEELKCEEVWGLWRVCAYGKIMHCVKDKLHMMIMGSQNPSDAWDKLEKTYSSRLANSQTMLMSKLVMIQYDGSSTLKFKG
jgi:hypothetical protein